MAFPSTHSYKGREFVDIGYATARNGNEAGLTGFLGDLDRRQTVELGKIMESHGVGVWYNNLTDVVAVERSRAHDVRETLDAALTELQEWYGSQVPFKVIVLKTPEQRTRPRLVA